VVGCSHCGVACTASKDGADQGGAVVEINLTDAAVAVSVAVALGMIELPTLTLLLRGW
jgi:hypothetical protein